MIARMGILTRKPGCSNQGFRDHWREVHGPLAARLPGLHGYHQNHVLRSLSPEERLSPEALVLDGISELWFDDVCAMRIATSSDEYQAVANDECNFMLPSKVIAVEQIALVIPSSPLDIRETVKCMSVLARAPDVADIEFRRACEAQYAEAISRLPGLTACTQNFVTGRSQGGLAIEYNALPIDAVAEFWFDSIAALDEAFSSEAVAQAKRLAQAFAKQKALCLVEVHAVV